MEQHTETSANTKSTLYGSVIFVVGMIALLFISYGLRAAEATAEPNEDDAQLTEEEMKSKPVDFFLEPLYTNTVTTLKCQNHSLSAGGWFFYKNNHPAKTLSVNLECTYQSLSGKHKEKITTLEIPPDKKKAALIWDSTDCIKRELPKCEVDSVQFVE